VKKGSIIVALAVAVLLGAGVIGAGASGSVPAKKRCHFVKKKVHGKIRRVRVCTKPKPKPKPRVMNVTVAVDSAHGASVVVGKAGGTVTAREADGTELTLALPPDAVQADTTITVTPVSSLRGLPKGLKLAAGVQFGPEGLALEKAGTLTLAGARAGTPRGLAWFASGKALSRYPSGRSGSAVTMRVTHFSGVGFATGPASAYADVPSAIAALRARYTSAVRPLLQQAVNNADVAGQALNAAFGLLREVDLLGLGSDFARERAEINAFLPKILQRALDAASEKCANHDLTQLTQLTLIERTAQLLGIQLSGGSAVARILRCARFELDYDSATAVLVPDGFADSHVTATVKLEVSADLTRITGSATLQLVGGGHSACGPATGQGSKPFVVMDLDIDLGLDAQGNPTGSPAVMLEMHPGMVESTVMCGDSATPNGYTYFPVWAYLHRAETDNGYASFKIGGWTWVGGATVASKTYERTEPVPNSGDGSFRETTTFVLRHTPEP
jgi:hypothetical protein